MRFEGLKATTRWVLTDAEGAFAILHAPDGRGALVVDAGDAGWSSRPDVKLPLPEGRTLSRPRDSAAVTGRVVEGQDGRTVPRASSS